MCDTVHAYLAQEKLGNNSLYKALTKDIGKFTQHLKAGGEPYYTGYIAGMRVKVSIDRFVVQGSLSKFYYGSNIHTLTPGDTKLAIEQLSSILKLPMHLAKVTRLDIADNFIVNYLPETYYPHLGESPGYDRLIQPHSLYYQNGNRKMGFYNKIEEIGKKEPIPSEFKGKNILRYELSLMKRINERFNRNILMKDLYNADFFSEMLDMYVDEFNQIDKLKQTVMDFSLIKFPTDFLDQLLAIKIHEISQSGIVVLIKELKSRRTFKHKSEYNRLKGMIKDLIASNKKGDHHDLIKELSSEIKAVKEKYL